MYSKDDNLFTLADANNISETFPCLIKYFIQIKTTDFLIKK